MATTTHAKLAYPVAMDYVRDLPSQIRDAFNTIDRVMAGQSIFVNGKEYPASGSVSSFTLNNPTAAGSVYAFTGEFTLPFAVPAGYAITAFVIKSSGFSIINSCALPKISGETSTVTFRLIQILSTNKTAVTLIGWQLVKA